MSNRVALQLLELAEIKYAQLKGMSSDGNTTPRLELPSDQIRALLWAVGLFLEDHLDNTGLELDALWSAVDPQDA